MYRGIVRAALVVAVLGAPIIWFVACSSYESSDGAPVNDAATNDATTNDASPDGGASDSAGSP